jgi:outer membrane protein OmpA-like peptidoglycan-associated protein
MAAALLVSGLMAVPALSQTTTPASPGQPVFRVTVVGRTISAVNYRPRSGETQVDFRGTQLMPDGEGHATIEGKDGYMTVDAHFDNLKPPSSFGREYLTYVLWAITPEGRATNLGEVQFDGDDANIEVTTELQAFALVLTAEPYFAVSQPSDVVVIENVIRPERFLSLKDGTQGRFDVVDAKYELLQRGTYLTGNQAADLNVKPLDPGAPLDLAEARNAVEIARLAGADAFAAETFAKATTLLGEAEAARERGRRGKEVQQPAREAVQTAEDARLIALQRQEAAARERERELAAQREADANARAAAEAARARAESERAQQEALRRQAIEAERLAAERAKAEADAARLAAERERQAADAARAAADAARLSAEAQAAQARSAADQARAAAEQAEREKAELRQRLLDQLNVVLETRETARGLIVNLSDVLFDFDRATLKPGAREKLAKIAGIVLAHPGLKLSAEGHTDAVGSDEYNQRLSERRAQSVNSYLVDQGIAASMIATAGFGESQPVATNGTAEGRQQNRRVELVVSGEPIGLGE